MRVGLRFFALAVALLVPATSLHARKVAPLPCGDGRFVFQSNDGELLVGSGAQQVVVVAGDRISIESGCPLDQLQTSRVRPARHATKLTASWKACGEKRSVRLIASISKNDDCRLMKGIRRAKKSRAKRFTATRSFCGDRILDSGNDEQCDGRGCPGGETCSDQCDLVTAVAWSPDGALLASVAGGQLVQLGTNALSTGPDTSVRFWRWE